MTQEELKQTLKDKLKECDKDTLVDIIADVCSMYVSTRVFADMSNDNCMRQCLNNIQTKLDKDNEEFSDHEPEYVEINKEDISIGDYIGIECERFGDPCHLRIVDIQQRYDEMTSRPYKIVIDEEGEIWSTRSGNCLSNPKTFYEIYGYFRELIK